MLADSQYTQGLADRLNDQRKEGKFCDVHLKVWGELTMHTHSCVLSACSPFFQDLILGIRPESPHLTPVPQEIVLDLPGLVAGDLLTEEEVAVRAMEDIIDYVYTGKIDFKAETVELLLQLAEVFMLDGLTSLGRNFAAAGLDAADCRVSEVGLDIEDGRDHLEKVDGDEEEGGAKIKGEVLPGNASVMCRSNRRGKKRRIAAVQVKEEEEATDSDLGLTSRASYTCRECGFVSADRQAIRDHRMIHNGKSYVCRTCDYITIKASKLVAHLLSVEHPETNTCSLCRFVADSPEAYRDHVLRHDHTEPFFCEQCDQRFRTRSTLTIHVAKHSAETPFACQHCPRTFKLKRSLQAHMVSHSGQKTHMCDYCGYRTAYKSSFNSHVLMHTGAIFVCTHEGCSFRSIRKKNLKDHILTHAPQKPFQCEVCGQNFSYEQSLKRHAKLHSPDKNLLTCDSCPFSTIRRDKLREHVRKHHKDGQAADQVDDLFHMLSSNNLPK